MISIDGNDFLEEVASHASGDVEEQVADLHFDLARFENDDLTDVARRKGGKVALEAKDLGVFKGSRGAGRNVTDGDGRGHLNEKELVVAAVVAVVGLEHHVSRVGNLSLDAHGANGAREGSSLDLSVGEAVDGHVRVVLRRRGFGVKFGQGFGRQVLESGVGFGGVEEGEGEGVFEVEGVDLHGLCGWRYVLLRILLRLSRHRTLPFFF